MTLFSKYLAIPLAALILCTTPAMADDDADTTGLSQNDVLSYLEKLVSWQRDVTAIEPAINTARELIFQDSLKQNSLRVLQSGFKFARNFAAHQPADKAEDASAAEDLTPRQRVSQHAQETDNQVKQLNLQLTKARGAQRAALQDQLKLATAKQELYQAVLNNMNAAESGESNGFLGKINNLTRAIPELAPNAKTKEPAPAAAPAATDASTTPATAQHTTTSLISLMADIFDITRKQRELADVQAETKQLEVMSRRLIQSLRTELDNVGGNAGAADAKAALSVDAKVTAYKQVAADILPLGDATLWLGINKHSLQDWDDTLEQQLKALLRQLAVHAAILAFTLAIPLAISEAVRRAIHKYVGDPKRQRQAQTARRVIAGLVIVFIIMLNFISDFSSFATFAGFMTAGLAVALQSVLLSLVSHFFFYGRYGVRKGDRITVSGVTGDILQIGIMRLYMSELVQEGDTFKPTGKIVTFPNSILFQPTAFYKYV